MELVPIYHVEHNPCCPPSKNGYRNFKSHFNLIKDHDLIITIFYVEKNDVDKAIGDDWDDAPSCCNSGSPYHDKYNVYIQRVKLGEPIQEPKLWNGRYD